MRSCDLMCQCECHVTTWHESKPIWLVGDSNILSPCLIARLPPMVCVVWKSNLEFCAVSKRPNGFWRLMRNWRGQRAFAALVYYILELGTVLPHTSKKPHLQNYLFIGRLRILTTTFQSGTICSRRWKIQGSY